VSVNQHYTFIDLFAGAGGLSEGFRNAGFTPVSAIESNTDAAETYERNFDCPVFRTDITDLNVSNLPVADLVIGGPPCQGFSQLGRMNGSNHGPLNALWNQYTRVLESVRPKVFVVENVPGFLRSNEFAEFKESIGANGLGYKYSAGVLNAANFGTPQNRKRAFTIGILEGSEPGLPVATGIKETTVATAIRDLPEPTESVEPFGPGIKKSGLELQFSRNPTKLSRQRYRLIPPGGNRFDLMRTAPEITPRCWLEKPTGSHDVFGRLSWDLPSVTIRTEFFKPEKGRYLHPVEDRPITHLEGALLQGFPFNYRFTGSKTSIARQIGNAVPPPLAQVVAEHVKTLLEA
jgi:DNA (cytosine-5)-methyltransferase 1